MKVTRYTKIIFKNPIIWLGVIAGLLYSSWPLAFILNPYVAHNAFASQLEIRGQPYNWTFIVLDVVSGAILLIGGLLQLLKARRLIIKLSILSYMLFGLLVIIAALVPFDCNSLITSCYDVAHSPLIIIHGFASIFSVVFLLASVFLMFREVIINKASHLLRLMVFFLISCWGFIGLAALLFSRHHKIDENIVQYVFITICSLSIALAVLVVEYSKKESEFPEIRLR